LGLSNCLEKTQLRLRKKMKIHQRDQSKRVDLQDYCMSWTMMIH